MNQTMECRTYYMAYEGTAQAKVIELIAEKQVATAAIQGKFSVEGISAMAEGVDARVALASSLADQDVKSGSALQKMNDVKKQRKMSCLKICSASGMKILWICRSRKTRNRQW